MDKLEKNFEERYTQIKQSIEQNKELIKRYLEGENIREADSCFIQIKKRLSEKRLLEEIREAL